MIRMSALRNYPVIIGNRQIGLVHSVILDEARKRVWALIIACGIRGKRAVPVHRIHGIADGFILADGEERCTRAHEAMGSPFVRDTTGLLVGCVTDYAIDEPTLNVLAVEMIRGYWPPESHRRIWIYAYQCAGGLQGDVIVPASLGSELI